MKIFCEPKFKLVKLPVSMGNFVKIPNISYNVSVGFVTSIEGDEAVVSIHNKDSAAITMERFKLNKLRSLSPVIKVKTIDYCSLEKDDYVKFIYQTFEGEIKHAKKRLQKGDVVKITSMSELFKYPEYENKELVVLDTKKEGIVVQGNNEQLLLPRSAITALTNDIKKIVSVVKYI